MKAITFLAALACILKVSHEFPFNFNKRNLDSLARTGQLPGNKRLLATLAKNGKLPEKLVQEKRMLDVLEHASDTNSKAIQEQRSRVEEIEHLLHSDTVKRQLLRSATVAEPDFRDEFKSELRATLNQYLKKFGTPYDQEKVELFLTNAADEVFDNHGIVSLDHIQFLIETGYFQQDRNDDDDDDGGGDDGDGGDGGDYDYAKPADGSSPSDGYYANKRFMASLARTGNMPYWYNRPSDVDKRYISSLLRQGVLPYGFQPTTESAVKIPGRNSQNRQTSKKDDAAYRNEEQFIPVMQGSNTLQNIIDDLVQEPMQKRYLGALSRSGWMPRGFASSSSFRHSPMSGGNTGYGKRHLAALARLGWLPSFRSPHSFYMRNGRGSSFQCDINKRTTSDDADRDIENIGRSHEEFGDFAGSSTATEQAQTDGMKAKRYLLLPAVDNILLRKQYPHLATNKI